MADVFISYSRRDAAFVGRLRSGLEARGKDVWLDVDGIRDGEVFPQALRRAIESSDAFVFVISPDSVRSPFCEQEVEHAVALNKRIVPLALRAVPDAEIPDEIRVRNWIPVGDGLFDRGVDRLVGAIETDLEWERQHTRLTVEALEWEAAGHDGSFLLRGAELAGAERWLAAGADKDPGPSALEQRFLIAGRTAAARRQRTLVAGSLVVAAVSVGLLVFALISRGEAISARARAVHDAVTANARALAAESETQLAIDPELSILLAAGAVRRAPVSQALFALRAAIDASPIRYRLPDAHRQVCGNTFAPAAPGVAFSPDGRRLAEGLCDGEVVIADARDGRVIRRIDVGAPAGAVAYGRDGSTLAAVAAGRLVLIDPSTGSLRATGARGTLVGRIAFDPPGDAFALQTTRGGLELWDVATGRMRTIIPERAGASPIGAVAFSPDGRRLAVALDPAGQGDAGVLLIDAASARVVASRLGVPATDVAFAPDGRALVVAQAPGDGSGSIVVLDGRTLGLRGRPLVTLPDVAASAAAFSPDGTSIAYGGYDGTAALLSARTGQGIVRYLGQTAAVDQIAFSPDGSLVATASLDGTLRIWRATGLELASRDAGGAVAALALAGRGVVALTQPRSGGIAVRSWPGFGHRYASAPLELSPTTVVDAAFLSANGRLAGVIPQSAQRSIPIRVWNVRARRVIATVPLSAPASGGEPVFSPGGSTIALSGYPAARGTGAQPPKLALMLVNARTGRVRTLASTTCESGWRSFPFSDDGALIAAGTSCGEVSVFDVRTGRRVGGPFPIGGELSQISFSPDGKRIAVGSWDSTVTVADADADAGTVVRVLPDNTKGVTDVAYSPNGHYLASASLDDTIRVWDARSFTLLRVIHQPDAANGLRFTADSRDILTFDDAGVVREWDACSACRDARALLALARSRVTRKLTRRERLTFGLG